MSEIVKITEADMRRAHANNPEARAVLEDLAPRLFCKGFKSGTIFFKVYNFADNVDPVAPPPAIAHNIAKLIEAGFASRLYLLCHLANAKEYGLFNLTTGYQLRRNDVYKRDHNLGIIIPNNVLDKLAFVCHGANLDPCSRQDVKRY